MLSRTFFFFFPFKGGIGCVCSFLWFAVIYDDPVSHPFISTKEKEYIVCSLAQEVHWGTPLPFPHVCLDVSVVKTSVEQSFVYISVFTDACAHPFTHSSLLYQPVDPQEQEPPASHH